MDIAALRERAKAARTLSITFQSATYTLVIPTDFDWKVIIARHQEEGTRATRALVDAALIAWTGVRVGDAVPESEQASEELPYSSQAAALLLDYRLDVLGALEAELITAFHARRTAREESQKNSAGASPSS